jgi:two-component system, OmpR family, sensor histidine kinase TctE
MSALSLRTRLVGMLALLFLGGTVVLFIAAQAYGKLAADKSYDRLLAGSALSIAETLSIQDSKVQVDLPYAALDMLSAAPDDRVFYRVFGPGSNTITGYDDLPRWQPPSQRGRSVAFEIPRFFDATYRGESVRFAVLGREIAEPDAQGWVWVQVGQTRRAREELARDLVLGAVVPITLMTLLALSLVMFGISRALRPLQRVGQDLSVRPPEDLQPVAEAVPREIAPLIDAINGFMRRLAFSIDALRAFIAEAAHQMRTPLASLRAQAHVAADEDTEGLRRSLAAVERNAARLSRLLDQLLSDATVTHRADVRLFEPFDLLELMHEAISEGVPHSRQMDVEVIAEMDRAPCRGDALMLGEALKNLIDNALKYAAAADEPVLVSLRAAEDSYLLSVADRGPGIPPHERERVFERFARGDSAVAGAGLGLAIVRRAVASHQGEVVLTERAGGGLEVTLRLPLRLQSPDP